MVLQVIFNGLVTGVLYALVALGFSLVYRGTRVFHLAHGAIYAAASYFFLVWASVVSPLRLFGPWFFCAVIVLTITSVCLLASAFEIVVYRPLDLRKAPPLVAFISSLGLYIATVNFIALVFGNETKVLKQGIENSLVVGDVVITSAQIIQLSVSSVFLAVVFFFLHKTKLGRNIRALSDNSTLLSVLGIDSKKIRLSIFLIGSLLAALSSLLKAFEVGIDPRSGFEVVLIATVAMIIGGISSYSGAVWSAVFLGLAQNFTVWLLSSQWQYAATFVVLVFVLVFRREGIFTTQLRLEER